jgi:hypothetical protein
MEIVKYDTIINEKSDKYDMTIDSVTNPRLRSNTVNLFLYFYDRILNQYICPPSNTKYYIIMQGCIVHEDILKINTNIYPVLNLPFSLLTYHDFVIYIEFEQQIEYFNNLELRMCMQKYISIDTLDTLDSKLCIPWSGNNNILFNNGLCGLENSYPITNDLHNITINKLLDTLENGSTDISTDDVVYKFRPRIYQIIPWYLHSIADSIHSLELHCPKKYINVYIMINGVKVDSIETDYGFKFPEFNEMNQINIVGGRTICNPPDVQMNIQIVGLHNSNDENDICEFKFKRVVAKSELRIKMAI